MTYTLTLAAAVHCYEEDFNTLYNFLDEDEIQYSKNINWLLPNRYGYIEIKESLTLPQIIKLRKIFNSDQIDIFCVEDKQRKLFMADMDATMVTTETLDELADAVGIKDKIASITMRAMQGEIDFHDALRERISLLKDLPETALEKTLEETQISKGAETLLTALKQNNFYCALVSGGFTYFTDAIATQLGFDKNHGNILDIQNGKLTGNVIDPILDKDSKLALLNHYADAQSLDLSDAIAIGDGANDLPMLQAAGLGIGYQPKPLVAETILNCIIHTDLTSVLYMQGIKP